MSTVRPVIAAVPNFNHGAALAEGGLVSSLLDSDYEQVVICDDASTQGLDELHELQSRFPGGVEVIQAQENGGAAAARNLVLQSSTLERVGSATIHFLDADVTPESSDNVARIHEIMHNR